MVCSRIAGLVVGCLALGALARPAASGSPSGPAPGVAPEQVPGWRFGDEIKVRLVPVVVRVVDGAGNPVLGLTPGDFRVRVGRREVPVAAVDWMGAAPAPPVPRASADAAVAPAAGSAGSGDASDRQPTGPLAGAGATGAPMPSGAAEAVEAVEAAAGPAEPPGKLVVIFVEADNNSAPRVRGHLKTLPFTRKVLAALSPADSVAVVSFDSHLKLWQDFTRDHELIPEVIYQAIHFGGRPPAPAGDGAGAAGPSLARSFDFGAALDAASPERALELTAEALSALPGEKEMIFLGWGLGTFSIMGTQTTRAFAVAAHTLAEARVSVFVLDVTEADVHSLAAGLEAIAEATGGTYASTFRLPDLAVRRLTQTMSGYYVLHLDAAALPRAGGDVEIQLRGHRQASVLLRSTSIPADLGAR
jgi:VWFA-related protein